MNTQYHTPSFRDDIYDGGDASTSTPKTGMLGGNLVTNAFSYQHQTPTQQKHMVNLHNTSSDEYYTANEDSFNCTVNNSMNNSIIQQVTNTSNNVPSPAGNITPTSSTPGLTTMAARKQMIPLDVNEPTKPLSAYALFFRDTVSAIKQQNPTCSFQELSKIVASMWDALDPVHKSVYNKKNELAKIEYIKQMRIYQQQQLQQQQQQQQQQINTTDSIQIQQQQQQTGTTTSANIISNQQQPQQNIQNINNNNNNSTSQVTNSNTITTTTQNTTTGGTPAGIQNSLPSETGLLQKCTRENCNKRAIINPDWEDEYCSNECVIIHCRNVFNEWVQSNIEAKQQQQQQASAT